MAGKRSGKWKSELEKDEVDEELEVESSSNTLYNNKVVKLQLRISAKLIANGPISGKRYEWERSGAIVEVDEADATELLEKRIGDKTCCGGSPDNLKVFTLI